jgi:hypothetical protein
LKILLKIGKNLYKYEKNVKNWKIYAKINKIKIRRLLPKASSSASKKKLQAARAGENGNTCRRVQQGVFPNGSENKMARGPRNCHGALVFRMRLSKPQLAGFNR